MIDGILVKYSVMEEVSTIRNFVVTGYGLLGWYFVIDGRLEKYSVMEAVSTISNLLITGDG